MRFLPFANLLLAPQELRARSPPFAMTDNVDNMADVYLQKLKVQINTWVDNIVKSCSAQ